MKNKVIILFVIVALIQLYVPAQMILGREAVIEEGQAFKFKTAPIDPSDPFRGKYLTLSFDATTFLIKDSTESFTYDEKVYARIGEDEKGFAKIESLSKEPPLDGIPYVQARIHHMMPTDAPEKIFITYPFDRFYMEESKAYDAELLYRKLQIDSTVNTYAVVHIKDGNAVVSDVMIDDVPLLELLKEK